MANTQYKKTILPRWLKPGSPGSIGATSTPAPLMVGPWKTALSGHDFVPAAYRVVYTQHSGGSSEWCSGNFTVGGALQEYPTFGVWRTVARTRFQLTAGCALQMRVIAVRSGPTETFDVALGAWVMEGKGGSIRCSLSYDNLASDTDSATVELHLPASVEANAWEPTTAGGSWGALLFDGAMLVQPTAVPNSMSEQVKWSEDTTITAEFAHEGAARVIHATLSEVPRDHVALHSREDVSVHGWPAADATPDPRPQLETRDGATFEDHRFGPIRSLQASDRQRSRCGPTLASWTSYAEALAEVADTDADPIPVTSTTYLGISIGSGISSWSTNNPGHDITGHYCRPAPENLAERLNGAAAIPVRVRVYARFTTTGTNTGLMKFQTSARSYVTITIPQHPVSTSYAWHGVTGWLECTAAADDTYPVLCDFAKVSGGTMEIRAWVLEYGEVEVAV